MWQEGEGKGTVLTWEIPSALSHNTNPWFHITYELDNCYHGEGEGQKLEEQVRKSLSCIQTLWNSLHHSTQELSEISYFNSVLHVQYSLSYSIFINHDFCSHIILKNFNFKTIQYCFMKFHHWNKHKYEGCLDWFYSQTMKFHNQQWRQKMIKQWIVLPSSDNTDL